MCVTDRGSSEIACRAGRHASWLQLGSKATIGDPLIDGVATGGWVSVNVVPSHVPVISHGPPHDVPPYDSSSGTSFQLQPSSGTSPPCGGSESRIENAIIG